MLAKIADEARPAWQRSALLRGAEGALARCAAAGSRRRTRRCRRPRDRCTPVERPAQRARAGEAGAGNAGLEQTMGRRAIPPSPEETAAAAGRGAGGGAGRVRPGGGGRGGGAAALRLSHEPGLVAFSTREGELNKRASAVLARIEWPGKPGALVITPLTAAEQQRFNAGRDVYRNLCLGCHQADGRGQENVAASLLGSELALGPAHRHGADSDQRQGRSGRSYAAARRHAQRRSDCRRS